MEMTVLTPDFSNPLVAATALAMLEESTFQFSFEESGDSPRTLKLAKTPLDDEEDEDEDEDLEDDDDDDDLEDDDLDDEDEDDDLEDDDDDDDEEDEDEDLEDDDDPKPLRVKTRG